MQYPHLGILQKQHEKVDKVEDDPFYQEEVLRLKLAQVLSAGELNRILKELKFKLFYDVYALEQSKSEEWQSETYMDVETLLNGEPVDAQEKCDELRLIYPLARVDAGYMEKFADTAEVMRLKLRGHFYIKDEKADYKDILDYFSTCASNLLNEWGEEPGSRSLAIMIESNYG